MKFRDVKFGLVVTTEDLSDIYGHEIYLENVERYYDSEGQAQIRGTVAIIDGDSNGRDKIDSPIYRHHQDDSNEGVLIYGYID